MLLRTFGYTNMKIAIFFLCALCIASNEVGGQDFSILRNSCLEEQGLVITELPALLYDDSEEGRRKRGCLELCFFEKFELMKDGKFDMDQLNNLLNKFLAPGEKTESMRQGLKQCVITATNAGVDDPCIVADIFTQCGIEEYKLNSPTLLSQMTL